MSHDKLLVDCTTLELLNQAIVELHTIATDTFQREAKIDAFAPRFAPVLTGTEYCLRELAGRMEAVQK